MGPGPSRSYDLIDNASQRSAERILEEYQHPAPGDPMPMFKELRGLAIAYTVTAFETNKWMVWVHRPHPTDEPDSTWTWRLTPLPGGGTQLVTRMKQDYRWETPRLALFNLALMEHHVPILCRAHYFRMSDTNPRYAGLRDR